MRAHLLALILTAALGLSPGCELEGLVFHLSDATIAAGERGEVGLVYREGNFFVHRGDVCGFEVHWSYDSDSLSFPDCEGPGSSHSCGTPPLPDGHPGLFCFCNASSPGKIEVAAITNDGITPLPAGPAAIGVFRVSVDPGAAPDLYPIRFDRAGSDDPSIAYVLCSDVNLETEQLGFRGAEVIVLE